MIDTTHLEELLQKDMDALRERLRAMGDLVLRQLEDAVKAFAEGNRKIAYAVVLKDRQLDVWEQHIDRLGQEFMIRHMPVAHQLRFVVAAIKTNSELERIGDYAEGIARRAVTLSESSVIPQRDEIVEMSRRASEMLRNAVDSFLDGNPDLALQTLEADRKVDDMNSAIFMALAHAPIEQDDLTARFALLGVVNRIERVADRACNIAEDAVYAARGEVLRHLPREDIRVLFLCTHNACRSQMAEAIARQVAPANFVVTSAGPDPQPLDEKTVEFLGKRGIEIPRIQSKGLEDVGPIEDYHVVVTLSHAAQEACPEVPYHAVALNWEIRNPQKVTGTSQEIEAAYNRAYERLRDKITELVEAFAGALEQKEDS